MTINGQPVSWGAIAFENADTNAPRPTARVMKGNFKLEAANGAVVGKHKLHVTYSAADVPGLDTPDGTAQLTVEAELIEGQPLVLDLKR